MGQPIDFKKQKVAVSCFHKKTISTHSGQKDPQARTIGSLVVHDGSQLSTRSPGYICRYQKALYFG